MTTDSTNRIDASLKTAPPGLWPFIAAGYPSLGLTGDLIRQVSQLPIRGIEIGFPFSDPVADGPTIQKAFNHALDQSVRVDDVLAMVGQVRKTASVPLLGMISCSIIYRFGLDRFISAAAEAGLDGLIVPDVPVEEATELSCCCREKNLRFPMLVAPTTPHERVSKIAELASGFLYYVSFQGTTGQRQMLAGNLNQEVQKVRAAAKMPVLVGFGISSPQHVAEVCGFADGAIVGSAIINQIGMQLERGESDSTIVRSTVEFVETQCAR